ncbi:lanthionine synthetase C family protein [Actinoplanes sp. NBC_00393]|uniref:lanthionine synthetase C family protein n=1 Tax=Actinoplanes sp. NBC_00393 TaxID=2975953 RepID=UPI002E245FB1
MNETMPTVDPQIVDAFAAGLADPAILSATSDPRNGPQSLAGGAVGIALLHIERAVSGHGPEAAAHHWLRAAAGQISAGANANLYHGVPALAFVLHTASALGGYARARRTLDDKTIAITRARLDEAYARIHRGEPLPMHEFDLIHGLTGLGVYHLHRHPEHPITRDVLAYLIRLTYRLPGSTPPGRPPWWLASGLAGTADPRYPHGHGNLGVAHGISAVIALLSLAAIHTEGAPAVVDAIAELCAWTDEHRHETGGESWWPGFVTDAAGTPLRHRPSWCYGTAGTARAQQLAGIALGDSVRRRRAETAMLATLRDPTQLARLPELGLCHGKAGLLQSAHRMATSSSDPDRATQLAARLPVLAAQLTAQLASITAGVHELLDGTAGALLALHTVRLGEPATSWDAFLLLT